MVFVDDGEGGRGHGLGDSELTADGGDEGGLAGAHLAIEGEDARGGGLRAPGGGGLRGRGEQGGGGDEVAGYCGEGLEVVDLMFHCFLGGGRGRGGRKREREGKGGRGRREGGGRANTRYTQPKLLSTLRFLSSSFNFEF